MAIKNQNFFSISFEGGDSTGKATQSALLSDHFRKQGLRVKHVEVPVNSAISHTIIYFMLKVGLAKKFPRLFHFVQFVNKFWWQTFSLPFIMLRNDCLILDRWHASYWVYGKETGLDMNGRLMRLYNALYKPDFTVVLCGSRRALERRDEYEKDDSLQERVRKSYQEWLKISGKNSFSVIAEGDIMNVHVDVLGVLSANQRILSDERT